MLVSVLFLFIFFFCVQNQPRPSSRSAKGFRWQNAAGMKSCTDEHRELVLQLSQLFLPYLCCRLTSSASFLLFCRFTSSFFSNSERVLVLWILQKKLLYLFLNLCACDYPKVCSGFACRVFLDNRLVHWVRFVWRRLLKLCSSDTCWHCSERQRNIFLCEFYCK